MEFVKLSDLCEVIMGQSPPSETYNSDGICLPFYQGKAEFTELYPIPVKWCNKPTKIANIHDVLLSVRAPVGAVNVASQSCGIGRGLAAIRYKNWKFIFYFLKSIEHELDKKGTGTTFKAISGDVIRTTLVPKFSDCEQQKIVYKIEELFSELDKSIEQLKTVQRQIKVYRRSVLEQILSNNHLKPIESIIEKLDQGWSPKCDNYRANSNEWGVIKTSAVQHGYFLDHENKRLPKELKPREQHELKSGDVLITRAGPRIRVGVCCLVKNVRPKLLNCDKVYRIRVNEKVLSPDYFEFVLNTPKYLDEIDKLKTGISDSGVNLTQKGFLKIEIPVPALQQQQHLVEEAQRQTSLADKLEEVIINELKKAEVLKGSILKKAFRGKLINE